MKNKILGTKKLTDNKWINLFSLKIQNAKGHIGNWIFASRKEDPIGDTILDFVTIVPTIETPEGKKLVVIKEWRWPINDYIHTFPAGLIDPGRTVEETIENELKQETGLDLVKIIGMSNPVYSSPGLSDESCVIAFVNAGGTISTKYQEKSEDIEVLVMGIDAIEKLLKDKSKKIGARAWGILFYYSKIGRIE